MFSLLNTSDMNFVRVIWLKIIAFGNKEYLI